MGRAYAGIPVVHWHCPHRRRTVLANIDPHRGSEQDEGGHPYRSVALAAKSRDRSTGLAQQMTPTGNPTEHNKETDIGVACTGLPESSE